MPDDALVDFVFRGTRLMLAALHGPQAAVAALARAAGRSSTTIDPWAIATMTDEVTPSVAEDLLTCRRMGCLPDDLLADFDAYCSRLRHLRDALVAQQGLPPTGGALEWEELLLGRIALSSVDVGDPVRRRTSNELTVLTSEASGIQRRIEVRAREYCAAHGVETEYLGLLEAFGRWARPAGVGSSSPMSPPP
jgi:hypothetical protein